MKALDKVFIRGIKKTIRVMEMDLDWFANLNPDRKLELAIQLLGGQKTSIQKYRFVFDIIPWIFALVALLRS
ncbi:MAG: hypothetical protein WC659_02410 [Patescibacteria group bacterium]